MSRKTRFVMFSLVALVLVALPVTTGAAPNANEGARLSADEAAAFAVNQLNDEMWGYRLNHPRRQVDFTPDGIRLEGRRGSLEWKWSLEAISSSSGRQMVDIGPVGPVAVERDLIRYDRCGVREEYRLKVDSVEQLFVIEEPLPLEGEDLVFVGAVSCDGDVREGGQGWTWRGARGEVTLGQVTVFDADGRHLPARFDVDEESTRLVVDGDALMTAAYPVVVDPELGSNDYRITTMGPDGNVNYDAMQPAVAYNSTNNTYLVVWEGDDTSGGLIEGELEIFGQLLSGSNGSQTGYNDVRISFVGGTGDNAYRAHDPDVAFNSEYNQFLVVWSADNPQDGCVDNEFEIWGQVVDESLFPLFGNNFRISTMGPDGNAAYDAHEPAVAYNPHMDEYLVVWEGDDDSGGLVDNEFEIWAQRVYSTAILVGSNLRMSDMGGTGNADYDALHADVAYNSRDLEYLIVWYGDDDSGSFVDNEFEIFSQRINPTGGGLGTNDYRLSDMGGTGDADFDAFAPAVAYNSRRNQYLVVWQGDDNVGGLVNNEFEVFSQRLTATITGLGSNDYRLSDVGGVGDPDYDVQWGPNIAYNPILDQYLVVWSGEDSVGGMINNEWEVFAQGLTWKVTGIGPNDERISDAAGVGEQTFKVFTPVVAANSRNGQFMVAWDGEDNVGSLVLGEQEIFVQRMDGMAIFVDGFEGDSTSMWSEVSP